MTQSGRSKRRAHRIANIHEAYRMSNLSLQNYGQFAMVLILLSLGVSGTGETLPDTRQPHVYEDRPVKLPRLSTGQKCPVSIGAKGIVSPTHPYIFGAGGYWLGEGPVYFLLAWKPADRAEGSFELVDRIAKDSEGYILKTPWIMRPDYKGDALVRGTRIGAGDHDQVLFRGPEPTGPMMILKSQEMEGIHDQLSPEQWWGFWPTHMILPVPGCYAIQIDTESKSEIVIFEATNQQKHAD